MTSPSPYVRDLRIALPSCGGKALGLSRLIAAELPVPPGFALDHAAFRLAVGDIAVPNGSADAPDDIGCALETAARRIATVELPRELEQEIIAKAAELGPHVMVRSSATFEDGSVGSAAGIFSSHASAAKEVWHAIRNVWTSALTPLAVAYARRRGQAIAIGVVVQRHVPGQPVTVYTRPPGGRRSDAVLIQRGGDLARMSRSVAPTQVADREAVEVALRAEQAIGARDSGADVELVQVIGEKPQTWVVQARPIVHPVPRALAPPPPIITAPLRDGRQWTWDVAHNPDPLSLAQIGLVERVERARLGAYALRVCAGYLYSAPRVDAPVPAAFRDAAELSARAQALFARAAAILAAPASTLADALEQYLRFYALWAGELAPLISRARSTATAGNRRPSSVEATLAGAARGELTMADVEARLGDLAPAWDVAVPAFGDRPGLLQKAVSLFGTATVQPARESGPVTDEKSVAEIAADLAERDDLLFARAQRLVRRALIARAQELAIDPDDVFWLPLDEVVAAEALDAETTRRRAAGARAAAERASQWQMPQTVGGATPPPPPADDSVLRGVGQGPRVTGRVVKFASLAGALFLSPGDVAVVRAVTPALAVFLGRCAALVSETGGLLDHGAAIARELGITCVVGCTNACVRVPDGALVTVDGDAGEVIPIRM